MGLRPHEVSSEFCLVETNWTNAGKDEAGGGANLLGSLTMAGKAIEHQDKDINRGFAVMDQRNMVAQPVLKAGKSAPQYDVYEVPDGTVPDAVWISGINPRCSPHSSETRQGRRKSSASKRRDGAWWLRPYLRPVRLRPRK